MPNTVRRREARVTYRASAEEVRDLRRKAASRGLSAGAFLRGLVKDARGPVRDDESPSDADIAAALRACGALTPEERRRLAETMAAFGEEGAWEG